MAKEIEKVTDEFKQVINIATEELVSWLETNGSVEVAPNDSAKESMPSVTAPIYTLSEL